MIYDTLENIETYYGINSRIEEGLRVLKDTDFSKQENGTHTVSDNVYFNIIEYSSTPGGKLEAHDHYADIQFVAQGEEMMGILPRCDLKKETEFYPERDLHLYDDEDFICLPLNGSKFIVLYPQDGHAPGVGVNPGETIRRVVVKVKLSD